MKRTDKIGNFVLQDRIESMCHLSRALETRKSIFWKFKMFPTAFIKHWSYTRLEREVANGMFWYAIKEEL